MSECRQRARRDVGAGGPRLGAAFGATGDQAQTVLDNRFGLLTRARRAVVESRGRRASVVVDGVELTGRGRTAATSVEALADR